MEKKKLKKKTERPCCSNIILLSYRIVSCHVMSCFRACYTHRHIQKTKKKRKEKRKPPCKKWKKVLHKVGREPFCLAMKSRNIIFSSLSSTNLHHNLRILSCKAKGTKKSSPSLLRHPFISTINSTQSLPSFLPSFLHSTAYSNQAPPDSQSAITYTTYLAHLPPQHLFHPPLSKIKATSTGRPDVSGHFQKPCMHACIDANQQASARGVSSPMAL